MPWRFVCFPNEQRKKNPLLFSDSIGDDISYRVIFQDYFINQCRFFSVNQPVFQWKVSPATASHHQMFFRFLVANPNLTPGILGQVDPTTLHQAVPGGWSSPSWKIEGEVWLARKKNYTWGSGEIDRRLERWNCNM